MRWLKRHPRPVPEVRFAADPESFFASYQPAAKHAAEQPGWFARLRAGLRPRHQPVHTAKVTSS